jgi:pimeloyl-ACP methyl ester carboxylesterase
VADETGPEAFIRQQTAILNRTDSRPGLAAIGCPVLVVAGADDHVTVPDHAAEIADCIPQGTAGRNRRLRPPVHTGTAGFVRSIVRSRPSISSPMVAHEDVGRPVLRPDPVAEHFLLRQLECDGLACPAAEPFVIEADH